MATRSTKGLNPLDPLREHSLGGEAPSLDALVEAPAIPGFDVNEGLDRLRALVRESELLRQGGGSTITQILRAQELRSTIKQQGLELLQGGAPRAEVGSLISRADSAIGLTKQLKVYGGLTSRSAPPSSLADLPGLRGPSSPSNYVDQVGATAAVRDRISKTLQPIQPIQPETAQAGPLSELIGTDTSSARTAGPDSTEDVLARLNARDAAAEATATEGLGAEAVTASKAGSAAKVGKFAAKLGRGADVLEASGGRIGAAAATGLRGLAKLGPIAEAIPVVGEVLAAADIAKRGYDASIGVSNEQAVNRTLEGIQYLQGNEQALAVSKEENLNDFLNRQQSFDRGLEIQNIKDAYRNQSILDTITSTKQEMLKQAAYREPLSAGQLAAAMLGEQ